MGDAVFEEETPFLAQPMRAAAVLCRTEYGNLHAGLLYRTHDQKAAVLHLGWQDQLCNDWGWQKLWAAPEVEPERLTSIAGLCRRIWERFERDRTFPYALRFAGSFFSQTGQLRMGEGAKGLTCATFILAVFNSAGISLVSEDEWPIRRTTAASSTW